MEAVLKQPDLLRVIGAAGTTDSAAWQFEPPADIVWVPDACPPRVTCRKGGEIFSTEWMAAAGDAGPLADTVILAQAAPVYVGGGGWTAYCRTEPAAPRALLRLPGPLGISGASASGPAPGSQLAANLSPDSAAVAAGPRAPRQVDVLRAVAWSLRTPTPVDLGPCDRLAQTVRESGAGVSAGADLNAAGNAGAGPFAAAVASVKGIGPTQAQALLLAVSPALPPDAEPTVEATPAIEATPAVLAAAPDFGFALARGITHDDNCAGHYILGSVMARSGAPMPGVHVALVDEWGNRADAWSKDGVTDAGRYDFPIGSTPNRYTLTIIDANGAPVSAPVTVEHQQGYGGTHRCHTIIWQAY